MKIHIVGNGGRERALLWAVSQSPLVEHALCGEYGDVDSAFDILAGARPDLVIVGPEAPLVGGLVDRLQIAGIPAFGPVARAAKLEGSKAFMKQLCYHSGVRTAKFGIVMDLGPATQLISHWGSVPVIKADGLCGGKGVVVPDTIKEALAAAEAMLAGEKPYGDAGRIVIIEDRLEGRECSMMWLCAGDEAEPLPPARDYKRALTGDKGLNTGGMGAYSPLPDVDDALVEEVRARIILPVLRVMKGRGAPFRGLLYVGLMLTKDGPYVLEFNVRFGDPETQVVLPRLDRDIVPYLLTIARNEPGGLKRLGPIPVKDDAAVCFTLASKGYPENFSTGYLISGLDPEFRDHSLVFRAGVSTDAEGECRTAGGRVLSVVGLGSTIEAARRRAEDRADEISYLNKYRRSDIALNV